MTTKLTLTIDDAVISAAKKYAGKKGRSLSAVVENYLKTITGSQREEPPVSSRILKMKGAIKLPENFDYKTAIGTALSGKYKK